MSKQMNKSTFKNSRLKEGASEIFKALSDMKAELVGTDDWFDLTKYQQRLESILSETIDEAEKENIKKSIKGLNSLWNRHKTGDKNESLSKYKKELKFWQGYLTGILASIKVIKSLSLKE